MTVSSKLDRHSADRVIARLAGAQHGVVALRQLRDQGVEEYDVKHRLRLGRLQRVYRGVYSLAPPPTLTVKGRWMAAVLACGPGAVISHATAGAHWDLRRSQSSIIDVTVPSFAGRARRPGIRLHRSATLTLDQCTVRERIPVTTVARTLVDLADRFDFRSAEKATDQAEVLGLFDLAAVERVIETGQGRAGARVMRRLLDDYTAGAGMTESELEDEFLRLCDRFGLERPLVQPCIGQDRPDFLC